MSKFDRIAAVRRAQRVRDNVVAVNELIETLIEIQECQDWLALGYKTWTEYCEGEFGALKLTAEQRGRVVHVLVASGMPKRRVAAALGISDGTVRNDTKRSRPIPGAQNYAPPAIEPQAKASDDITVALTQAIEETAAHTSAAGPAANPEGDSPVLGEPVDVGVAAASTGTQTAAEGADTTEADGAEVDGTTAGQAFRSGDAPAPDGDAAPSSSGVTPTDSPAAASTPPPTDEALPPEPGPQQQPGQDSPTGREGGRSETIHQQVAGVSPAGVAPGSGSGPQHADPVEPVELEDGGDASLPPSSSDPVLMAFAALLILIRQVDVEALGPRLFDEEMALLDQHVDDIALFVAKLGKARFTEMLHTQ